MDINEYIRLKIKQIRIEKGLSQRDLARLIGRSENYILAIESGEIETKILPLLKFCEVLKINPHTFYGEFYGRM